jgi:hypothetical protein
LYSGAKAVGKEVLKTGSNIITAILNNEPEQPMRKVLENRFSQAKGNLEEKIKKMTVTGLALKRKRKTKNSQSPGKRRKMKNIFTAERKRRNNGVFKVGSRYLAQA